MTSRGRLIAMLALAATLVVVVAVLALPRGGPLAAPSPTPTATQTSSPSATASPTQAAASPSPSPTASPSPSPQSGRFVSVVLGYSIGITPPWRWSDCFSGRFGTGAELMVNDLFVTVPEYDIRGGGTGVQHDNVQVFARPNPEGLSPRQWYESEKMGKSVDDVLTDVTFAGRPALLRRAGVAATYVVRHEGRMFEVSSNPGTGENTPEQRAAVIATFRFLSPEELAAARATPTPLPPRTPEQVADVLADGFAKKDVAILATVITPSCVSLGVNQGGGFALDDRRYLDELRERFARGLTVTVMPRPLTGERTGDLPTLVVRSTWAEPGQPERRMDLMISPEGQRWYWRGAIDFGPER